jgi:plastocyanin
MSKRLWAACAVLAAGAIGALGAGMAAASSHTGGLTIKAMDQGMTYVINKSATDKMFFSPGTATIKSGETLTFEYAGNPAGEPHTITILAAKQLPKTTRQLNECSACRQLASGHLENPHAPPGPTNDIAHWIVNKGKPGLDEPGDSIAIEGSKHRSISIRVTAPAGTTLHFICAVHPWMQGTLKVT